VSAETEHINFNDKRYAFITYHAGFSKTAAIVINLVAVCKNKKKLYNRNVLLSEHETDWAAR